MRILPCVVCRCDIKDCFICDNAIIREDSTLSNCTVGEGVHLPPESEYKDVPLLDASVAEADGDASSNSDDDSD